MAKRKLDTSLNGIPRGNYCYHIDGKFAEDGSIPIRLCPYWQRIKGGAKCQYLNLESRDYDPNLIWDQIKVCGVHLPPSEPDDYE